MSKQYDERQILLRGTGYKLGFCTFLIYNFVYVILIGTNFVQWISPAVGISIGIFLAIIVNSTYCIWHDVYFALRDNPIKSMIIFVVLLLSNFLIGIDSLKSGNVFVNGVLTFRSLNLIVSIMFTDLFIVVLLRYLINRKQRKSDTVEGDE